MLSHVRLTTDAIHEIAIFRGKGVEPIGFGAGLGEGLAELCHLVGGKLVEVGPDGVFGGGGGLCERMDELEEEVLLLLEGAAGADVALKEEEVVLKRLAADKVVGGVDVGEEDLHEDGGGAGDGLVDAGDVLG